MCLVIHQIMSYSPRIMVYQNFLIGFKTIRWRQLHLLMTASTFSAIKIKDTKILNSDSEKLLGFTTDSKLNFNNYFDKMLEKDNQEVYVLARITTCMSIPKRKLLIDSLFTHRNASIVFMNKKIKYLYEKCLRSVYNDKTSSEAVVQRYSVKKVFLEISQNSQEYTCARPWHRCFLVNFATFLRTPFYIEHPRWLLLHYPLIRKRRICNHTYKKLANTCDWNV